MLALLLLVQAAAASSAPSADTLRVPPLAAAHRFDGDADAVEYGAPSLTIPTREGGATVWVRHDGAHVVIAAVLTDRTIYWGDDFIVSLDPEGDGGSVPGDGDMQWYLRRTADSSHVTRAAGGRWEPPGGAPPLGKRRWGDGWELRSVDGEDGWSLELRLAAVLLRGTGGRAAAIAFRTFDDQPEPGWYTWPSPPPGTPPIGVERQPALWAPLRLE